MIALRQAAHGDTEAFAGVGCSMRRVGLARWLHEDRQSRGYREAQVLKIKITEQDHSHPAATHLTAIAITTGERKDQGFLAISSSWLRAMRSILINVV